MTRTQQIARLAEWCGYKQVRNLEDLDNEPSACITNGEDVMVSSKKKCKNWNPFADGNDLIELKRGCHEHDVQVTTWNSEDGWHCSLKWWNEDGDELSIGPTYCDDENEATCTAVLAMIGEGEG